MKQDNLEKIKTDTVKLLEQSISLLESIPAHTFNLPLTPSKNSSHSSFGAHYRHAINFFECFFQSLSTKVIDYEMRIRDVALETNPKIALAKTLEISKKIQKLSSHSLSRPLTLQTNYDLDTTNCTQSSLTSSLARELLYISDHYIHHMALGKIVLSQVAPDFFIDPNFGMAPSTLRANQSN